MEGTCGRQRQKLDERHCAAGVNSQILRRSFIKAARDSGSLETYCVDGLWALDPPRMGNSGFEGPDKAPFSCWLPLAGMAPGDVLAFLTKTHCQ